MKLNDFNRAINEGDFAVGDSFWINGIEFEVLANNRFLFDDKDKLREMVERRIKNGKQRKSNK